MIKLNILPVLQRFKAKDQPCPSLLFKNSNLNFSLLYRSQYIS